MVLIDHKTLQPILSGFYDYKDCSDGLIRVEKNLGHQWSKSLGAYEDIPSTYYFIEEKRWIGDFKYYNAQKFEYGLAIVSDKIGKTSLLGVINKNDRIVVPFQFGQVEITSDQINCWLPGSRKKSKPLIFNHAGEILGGIGRYNKYKKRQKRNSE